VTTFPPSGNEELTCDQARLSLGVLVLGVIDPDERPALEAHLARCPDCSAELADLAVLPGLLHRLDPTEAAAGLPTPSPEFTDRLVAAARQATPVRHRQRRVLVGAVAAAAAALIALGGVFLPGLMAGGDKTGQPVDALVKTTHDPTSGVDARFTLRSQATGTRLTLALGGVASGTHCQLVAVDQHGSREVAASWVASYAGRANVTGTTSFATGSITRLEVVRADGRLLAHVDVPAARA
jgi:putative zinc finger protein